jgi:hypothetical protein
MDSSATTHGPLLGSVTTPHAAPKATLSSSDSPASSCSSACALSPSSSACCPPGRRLWCRRGHPSSTPSCTPHFLLCLRAMPPSDPRETVEAGTASWSSPPDSNSRCSRRLRIPATLASIRLRFTGSVQARRCPSPAASFRRSLASIVSHSPLTPSSTHYHPTPFAPSSPGPLRLPSVHTGRRSVDQ